MRIGEPPRLGRLVAFTSQQGSHIKREENNAVFRLHVRSVQHIRRHGLLGELDTEFLQGNRSVTVGRFHFYRANVMTVGELGFGSDSRGYNFTPKYKESRRKNSSRFDS